MKQSRRSFLKSLIAAVALSPLLSRLIEKPEVIVPSRPQESKELWEQKTGWDGTLSPYFLVKYGYASKPILPSAGTVIIHKNSCS